VLSCSDMPDTELTTKVRITGIDISVGDLIGLILKFAIASIPAAIVLALLLGIISAMLGALV
jgi:hypothetical protein